MDGFGTKPDARVCFKRIQEEILNLSMPNADVSILSNISYIPYTTNHINRSRNPISILLEKSAFNLHAFENRCLNYVNGKIRSEEELVNIPLPPASADKVTFTGVQLSQIVCITPSLSMNPNF